MGMTAISFSRSFEHTPVHKHSCGSLSHPHGPQHEVQRGGRSLLQVSLPWEVRSKGNHGLSNARSPAERGVLQVDTWSGRTVHCSGFAGN